MSTTLTRDNLTGPWAGLPVAWTDDDRFDEPAYREDLAACCRAGLPGVYTGGSTGEFYALSGEEFQAVSRATVEVCHEYGTPAIIGCTDTCTSGARRKAAFAAAIGADGSQVALPFWLPVPADGFVLMMRQYLPGPAILDGSYELPPIEVVDTP